MISNFSKQSGTKRHFTNAILTADKGEEELYIRHSFPVWNKTAACEPVKHPRELCTTALTRGDACFTPKKTYQTPNIQKSGFGSPLRPFLCISIWKISVWVVFLQNWFHVWTKSRLEQFIVRLCARIYPSSENQTSTTYCPQTSKPCGVF